MTVRSLQMFPVQKLGSTPRRNRSWTPPFWTSLSTRPFVSVGDIWLVLSPPTAVTIAPARELANGEMAPATTAPHCTFGRTCGESCRTLVRTKRCFGNAWPEAVMMGTTMMMGMRMMMMMTMMMRGGGRG